MQGGEGMAQDITDVHEVAGRLLGEAERAPSGRASETIVSGSVQRCTVIALSADAILGEHDSPPAATLHVISGRVRLRTNNEQWELEAGQLTRIPPRRHSLEALEDSAVLLTVSLHG
jgi:quercetin dioxygenase-like cupin family protein